MKRRPMLIRALESIERNWPPAGEIKRERWADRFSGAERRAFNERVLFPAERLGLVILCRRRNVAGNPSITIRLHPGIKRGIFREPQYGVTG